MTNGFRSWGHSNLPYQVGKSESHRHNKNLQLSFMMKLMDVFHSVFYSIEETNLKS